MQTVDSIAKKLDSHLPHVYINLYKEMEFELDFLLSKYARNLAKTSHTSKEICRKKPNGNWTHGYQDTQEYNFFASYALKIWGLGGPNANRRSDIQETCLAPPTCLYKFI